MKNLENVKCLDCENTGQPEVDPTVQVIYFPNGTVKAILCAECRKRYIRPPNINDYL